MFTERTSIIRENIMKKHHRISLSENGYENMDTYRTLVDSFPIGIGIHQDGKWIMLNRTLLEILGYSNEDELIGQPVLEVVDQQDKPIASRRIKKIMKSGKDAPPLEETLISRSGQKVKALISARAIPYHGKPAIQVAALDLTAFKKVEDSLERERTQRQEFLDIAGFMFIILDKEGIITFANKKACHNLGFKQQNLVGQNWFETCIPTEYRKGEISNFHKILKGGIKAAETSENIVLTRAGDKKLISWHNTITRDEKGDISAIVCSGEDITEQRAIESNLKESREYGRNLIDSSMDMIIAVDDKRRITEFNRAAEETFGYQRVEVLGKHINLLYANTGEGRKVHKETVQRGQHVQEIENKRKNGEIFPTLLSASVLKDLNGKKSV